MFSVFFKLVLVDSAPYLLEEMDVMVMIVDGKKDLCKELLSCEEMVNVSSVVFSAGITRTRRRNGIFAGSVNRIPQIDHQTGVFRLGLKVENQSLTQRRNQRRIIVAENVYSHRNCFQHLQNVGKSIRKLQFLIRQNFKNFFNEIFSFF